MTASSKTAKPDGRKLDCLFAFEHSKHPLLPWPAFIRRMLVSLALGVGVVAASLAIGMLGYHYLENLNAVDSFLNAAMILGGMGPVAIMHTDAGKIFAGLYALYSGLAVLATAGLIFAPLIHRLLHRFHAYDNDEDSK
jgi:hypothetical protein